MSYYKQTFFVDTTTEGGRYSVRFFGENAGNPPFSVLYDSDTIAYPGSVIQVYEEVVINTAVVDDDLVGIDYQWHTPHKKLGNVQFANYNLAPANIALSVEDEFYLKFESQVFRRKSFYHVSPNVDIPIALGESINLTDCNFALQPNVVFDPGEDVPINGALTLHRFSNSPAVLKGRISLTPRSFSGGNLFYPLIPGVGIYCFPGVIPQSVVHYVEIANQLPITDAVEFPVETCNTAVPSCDEQFNAFVQDNGYYYTMVACTSVPGAPCVSSVWICPTAPSDIRTYYRKAPL